MSNHWKLVLKHCLVYDSPSYPSASNHGRDKHITCMLCTNHKLWLTLCILLSIPLHFSRTTANSVSHEHWAYLQIQHIISYPWIPWTLLIACVNHSTRLWHSQTVRVLSLLNFMFHTYNLRKTAENHRFYVIVFVRFNWKSLFVL